MSDRMRFRSSVCHSKKSERLASMHVTVGTAHLQVRGEVPGEVPGEVALYYGPLGIGSTRSSRHMPHGQYRN